MKVLNKFLALGLMVLLVSCGSVVKISKDVNYDYDVQADLTKLKTYDLRPIPTTIGIERLMVQRIIAAINLELGAKNIRKTSINPDFFVTFYGVRSKIFTTAWRGFDADFIIEKGKLLLRFVDPKSNQVIWWGETAAILDPNLEPQDETQMVNDAVRRILQEFPPAS
jgi:hypothetical protein